MPKLNTGLRLDPDMIARVDEYLSQLRREPGRSDASQADAIRTLIDYGLEHASAVLVERGERLQDHLAHSDPSRKRDIRRQLAEHSNDTARHLNEVGRRQNARSGKR